MYIILPNIRSVYNTASIFRTADGAGVEKIFLCGTTPAPIDRFNRERKDFAKVALGAEKTVAWEYGDDVRTVIEKIHGEGVDIVAVEQDDASIEYTAYTPKNKTAFIFGEETIGINKEVLDASEAIIEIPMKGKKESLNVSVTAGIILFHYRDCD